MDTHGVERAVSSRTEVVTVGVGNPARDDKTEAPLRAGARSVERMVPIAKSLALTVDLPAR